MLSEKFGATAKKAVTNIVLVTNAFVWYYLVIRILDNISINLSMDQSTTILMWTLHFAGFCVSAIAGALVADKAGSRIRFLTIWMAVGILFSLVSMVVDTTYVPNILLLSLFLGVSLGVGMPSCMGYFTENTRIEKRGRTGGIIILISGITMAAIGFTARDNISLQAAILSAWRIFGLTFFLLFRNVPKSAEKNNPPSYMSLFSHRPFVLYLVPWILFSLITYLTTPIQYEIIGKSTVEFLIVVENVFIGVFAVVGGFLLDIVGRKRVAIAGFALLGLGYSVLGIYPMELSSWYLYTVVDGVAWGMLFVIFVITIWGELSNNPPSDKNYAVGVMPFFVSKALQFTIGNEIASIIPTSAIFSFTALFLFLAVLPLVYAPETLPEKVMKERELKTYVEKAQEIAQKYY